MRPELLQARHRAGFFLFGRQVLTGPARLPASPVVPGAHLHSMNYQIDPDSQATQVRTHFRDILARHVTGESLQSIGQSLPEPLTGAQIRRAISDAPDMLLSFNAIIADRAHFFMEEAAALAKKCGDVGDVAGMKTALQAYMAIAAKIAPSIYGDKATLELVGAGGGPVKHVVELDPAEAYKKMLGGADK